MIKLHSQTWLSAVLAFVWILTITMEFKAVHANPVRIQQSTSSLNINGKDIARDIFKELSPEVEAPLHASFEFGMGDKSDSSSRRRRNERYGLGGFLGK